MFEFIKETFGLDNESEIKESGLDILAGIAGVVGFLIFAVLMYGLIG